MDLRTKPLIRSLVRDLKRHILLIQIIFLSIAKEFHSRMSSNAQSKLNRTGNSGRSGKCLVYFSALWAVTGVQNQKQGGGMTKRYPDVMVQ